MAHYPPLYRTSLRALSTLLPLLLLLSAPGTAGAKRSRSRPSGSTTRVHATAYHASCRACGTGRKTATGRSAHGRGVAADPRVFPLGTVLFIPGYGRARVDDTGGRIRGRRIDVRFSSHAATRHWGSRAINVRVVSRPRK